MKRLQLLLLVVVCFQIIEGGHEVLYKFANIGSDGLEPDELAVVQFDSRPQNSSSYWQVSIHWNAQFCRQHKHKYFFLSIRKPNSCFITREGVKISLADPWCKVKAMTFFDAFISSEENLRIKAVLFIDSDALITLSKNYSMSTAINFMRESVNWRVSEKPIAFNQDGPGWSCKNALSRGYSQCLNSGTVLWFRSAVSTKILNFWWQSAADPYQNELSREANTLVSDECSPSNTDKWPPKLRYVLSIFTACSVTYILEYFRWRHRWPWEQAKQYAVHLCFASQVQLLSFPKLPFLPWTSHRVPQAQYPSDAVQPWCFSHWPGKNEK